MQITIHDLQNRIAQAARKVGREPDNITLVAVSKTYPAQAVARAYEHGLRVFGESRVQEAVGKIPSLPSDAEWHFIGHLQRNKVRAALPLFHLIHSVDTLSLAVAIDRIAGELGLRQRILLEVNISGERSKHGFPADVLPREMEQILALPNLDIRGLMTMAPYDEEAEAARPVFAGLRELRDRLKETSGLALPELSMGMSGDFQTAIEEGATMVRIGSALFGSSARQG